MGYKLFVKGIFREAGDVEVKWDDNKILLKRAAPGTFFAVCGTVIIIGSFVFGKVETTHTIKNSAPLSELSEPDSELKELDRKISHFSLKVFSTP